MRLQASGLCRLCETFNGTDVGIRVSSRSATFAELDSILQVLLPGATSWPGTQWGPHRVVLKNYCTGKIALSFRMIGDYSHDYHNFTFQRFIELAPNPEYPTNPNSRFWLEVHPYENTGW